MSRFLILWSVVRCIVRSSTSSFASSIAIGVAICLAIVRPGLDRVSPFRHFLSISCNLLSGAFLEKCSSSLFNHAPRNFRFHIYSCSYCCWCSKSSRAPCSQIFYYSLLSKLNYYFSLQNYLIPIRYPPSFFLQLLILPSRTCFVAYDKVEPNAPIGFISASTQPISPDEAKSLDPQRPRLEILTLGVLPAYQQCGLARLLMRSIVKSFRDSCAGSHLIGETLIHANVSTSNMSAIKFYEHMGMKISYPIIRNLYRTLSAGSKDAYLVVGVWVLWGGLVFEKLSFLRCPVFFCPRYWYTLACLVYSETTREVILKSREQTRRDGSRSNQSLTLACFQRWLQEPALWVQDRLYWTMNIQPSIPATC